MLMEDIEWAIEVISANKLYTGSMSMINFNRQRPEIEAWLDQIDLKNIPKNINEMERLREYEEHHKLDS